MILLGSKVEGAERGLGRWQGWGSPDILLSAMMLWLEEKAYAGLMGQGGSTSEEAPRCCLRGRKSPGGEGGRVGHVLPVVLSL